MILGSAQVETTLLVLKLAFLVLLYLFIWRIVRSAARDLRLPQESMILAPQQAAAAGLVPQPAARELGRLVVLASPALDGGESIALDSHPLTVGRGNNNDVALPEDEYASGRHARFEPRRDGIWIEDIYVRPSSRKLGIGRALFSRIASLAVERDWPRVEWAVLEWNQLDATDAGVGRDGAGRHGCATQCARQ